MKTILALFIVFTLAGCSSYKDGKTPSDILNIYNEAALNFDYEAMDKVTAKSDKKEQLKDAMDFMKDNHLFFEALKAKFPDTKDEAFKDRFPVLFEIYSQMAAKKSKGFKEIDYKVDYQGEDAMIFEISTKQAHTFKKIDGQWKKVFGKDEINFHRSFYLPEKSAYKEYMQYIAESKTFQEFKDHWVQVPVEDIEVTTEEIEE